MGFFDAFKKKSSPNKEDNTIKHYKCGRWEQYDVLMSVNFSWQMIVELANYMASTDISNIDQVSISDHISGEDKDQTYEFAFHGTVRQMPSLANEHAALGLAGTSKTLNALTKIVWFNQTRIIRVFTTVKDQTAIRDYADKILNKDFGTADETKQCSPSPELQASMKKQQEKMRFPFSSRMYSRLCFVPQVPSSLSGLMGTSTCTCGFGLSSGPLPGL